MLLSSMKRAGVALTFCSIALGGAHAEPNLYGLIQTDSFNELQTYDLNQNFSVGFNPSSLIPLNYNTNLIPQNSIVSVAAQDDTLYGLIRTTSFNELQAYNLNQNFSFGYQPDYLIPLNYNTNLNPQNSITSISVAGKTLYALVTTNNVNELMAYDLTQNVSFGFDPSYLIPLNYNTNLIPQNSIVSISVSGNTLYALVRTNNVNELMAYDLTQNVSFGFDPSYLIPLNYNTNLIPQNSIVSISVSGNTLYALVRTNNVNELMAYDLTQNVSFGFDPSYLIPLNYDTTLIPQNSIIGIAVSAPSDGGGGAAAPEPSTWALMIVGFAGLGFAGYRARQRTAAVIA